MKTPIGFEHFAGFKKNASCAFSSKRRAHVVLPKVLHFSGTMRFYGFGSRF
jgi:hypothetical protein